MKFYYLLVFILPLAAFSQSAAAYKPRANDSLQTRFFQKKDSVRLIRIPNKKASDERFYGLISKTKGNAMEIPNKCKAHKTEINNVSAVKRKAK